MNPSWNRSQTALWRNVAQDPHKVEVGGSSPLRATNFEVWPGGASERGGRIRTLGEGKHEIRNEPLPPGQILMPR